MMRLPLQALMFPELIVMTVTGTDADFKFLELDR